MINVRVQTDSVKSIIGATTDELRAIYRPIKNYAQSEIEEPVCIVAVIDENIIGAAEYLVNKNHALIRNLAVSPTTRTVIINLTTNFRKRKFFAKQD